MAAALLVRRIDGLLDEPRPGTPRKLSDEQVEQVLARTLESQPRPPRIGRRATWPRPPDSASPASAASGAPFRSQPHRAETFKLSSDPLFIEKVRDIVGLYLNPPERALVLCVDEKSQIQALDRTAPLLPMRPGQIERRTHDYAATAPPACLPRWMPRPAK